MDVPYDPTNLLAKSQKELNIGTWNDTCTPMFIAALFSHQTWTPPNCPSTDKWINKMWYTHTMKYYSAIKGNGIVILCYNMDEP